MLVFLHYVNESQTMQLGKKLISWTRRVIKAHVNSNVERNNYTQSNILNGLFWHNYLFSAIMIFLQLLFYIYGQQLRKKKFATAYS